jgi:hypothetical protein
VEYIRPRLADGLARLPPTNSDVMDEPTLARLEQRFRDGVSSADILDVFATHDIALSEGTLRKYVQLGLLPRSVRVGTKGKHRGSRGIYPVSVLRQIVLIKRMMANSYTIEQIQREFLFMRSDLEQLEHLLEGLFSKVEGALRERKRQATRQLVVREVSDAHALSRELLRRLSAIESQLTSQRKVDRTSENGSSDSKAERVVAS